MQLAKDDRSKMKKVIFTLVCTASLFFGAVCANSDDKECICFPDLKTINCSQNGFYQNWPDIATLENCTGEYTSIDLSHNKFDEYPTESKGYEFVNISNNHLKKFRPSPLETKILDVSSNIIDDMSLKPCSKLEKLYAANNSLNENNFECGSCGQLLVLDLSQNKFKGFGSITNCEKLLALDMSYNAINSIPQDFYSLKSLKNVSFFNNELKFLNDLPGSVVRLNISKNKLTEVKKTYFIDLKALEILDLSDNSISTVHDNAFAELPALEMIDLSNNKLMTLPLLELCENVRNVMLLKNKITDMNGTVVMHLLNSTDREVDMRDNPIRVVSKRQFVLYLDNSGAHIVWYKNCTCFDVSCGNATLKFCAEEEGEVEEDECWVTIARMSSTSTISTTTTSTEQSSVARITEGNATRAEGVNESVAGAGAGAGAGADSPGDAAAVEQAAFLGLSGSKLSFLGFLLLTFLALLVANCVAGHPVVDERWWEETLRGDRVVS